MFGAAAQRRTSSVRSVLPRWRRSGHGSPPAVCARRACPGGAGSATQRGTVAARRPAALPPSTSRPLATWAAAADGDDDTKDPSDGYCARCGRRPSRCECVAAVWEANDEGQWTQRLESLR